MTDQVFRAGIHRASKMTLLLHHAPLAVSPGKDALLLNTWVLGASTWVPGYQGTSYQIYLAGSPGNETLLLVETKTEFMTHIC